MLPGEQTVGDEIPAGCELIDVHLAELSLLFHAMDPAPLRAKDLDPKVEEFIVSWARLSRSDVPFALQVYVDEPGLTDQFDTVRQAIHDFFKQRALSTSRRLSQLFRVGRTSLLIGIVFLALAIILAGIVERALGDRHLSALIREGMVIGGWVAMWRPLEIFLYDWWPIRGERKLFERLGVMPIRIRFKSP
jgi:hypothetical protein